MHIWMLHCDVTKLVCIMIMLRVLELQDPFQKITCTINFLQRCIQLWCGFILAAVRSDYGFWFGVCNEMVLHIFVASKWENKFVYSLPLRNGCLLSLVFISLIIMNHSIALLMKCHFFNWWVVTFFDEHACVCSKKYPKAVLFTTIYTVFYCNTRNLAICDCGF